MLENRFCSCFQCNNEIEIVTEKKNIYKLYKFTRAELYKNVVWISRSLLSNPRQECGRLTANLSIIKVSILLVLYLYLYRRTGSAQ